MVSTLIIVTSISVGLTLIRLIREWQWGRCKSKHSLKGITFLITGSNSGVGKETARQLLQREATVIMANRDAAKTQKAIQDIRKTTTNGEVVSIHPTLFYVKSIKA